MRGTVIAIGLLAAGQLLGCAASAASNAPPNLGSGVSAEEEAATVGLVEHHRHHHHGGVTLLIAMSLDTLGVSPEQKPAVERVRGNLLGRMDAARTAEQGLLGTLADGLAAGAIDPAKVDAAVAALAIAAATSHEASADALNELHAILTPSERAALVDKVEAHWSVWQKANAEEGDRLVQLTEDLDLAPDQVDKIRAIRAGQGQGGRALPGLESQQISAHVRAFSDAFRSATFDAKALADGGAATAHMAGWGAAHMARFVESVMPVLTAEQRGKLAQLLRSHASHNPSANGG